jgi:glycosyltransferase involved in cell wall biosynthesis
VKEYLAAADCGVMLKAPGRLDRYWQPVKFAEYLAAGVPVIVSARGVGRVAEIVDASGAGVVVDYSASSNGQSPADVARVGQQITQRGDAMRRAALALCEKEFMWPRYTSVVRGAYARALERARP